MVLFVCRLSLLLNELNNSRTAEQIFMVSDTEELIKEFSIFQFLLKLNKTNYTLNEGLHAFLPCLNHNSLSTYRNEKCFEVKSQRKRDIL
jgi:hypothetical protein